MPTEIARQTVTRPAELPHAAVVVGREAGYSAARHAVDETLSAQAGNRTPEFGPFIAQAIARMSESDIQSLSPKAREVLARYQHNMQSIAEIDRWASNYAKDFGNQPVRKGAQQELVALLHRLDMKFPTTGGTIEINGKCVVPDARNASGNVLQFTSQCNTEAARSWLMDAGGHIRTLLKPGACLSGSDQGDFGLPLTSCTEGAQRWSRHEEDGHTFVKKMDDGSQGLIMSGRTGRLTYYGHGQHVAGLKQDDNPLLARAKPETLDVVGRVLSADAVPDPALPPEAKAGADQTVVATSNSSGYAYSLDGTQSSDPAGKKLTYQWRKVSGPFTLRNEGQAKAEAIVPKNTTGTGVYELTVTNDAGQSAKATAKVTAIAPSVTVSGDASIDETQAASYSAKANFDDVTYTWSARNASSQEVAKGSGASWSTPTTLAAGNYTVSVQASSKSGEREATAQQTLAVKAAPKPEPKPEPAPELTAKISGLAQAESGATITLDASTSTGPEGMFFHWMAAKGDMRDQSGGNFGGKRLIVKMPQVSKDTPLTFKLTAYADGGKFNNTATHTVVVKAKAAPQPEPQPEPKPKPTPSAPAYQAGKAYSAGEVVSNGGKLYECKPWPYTGWCGQAPAAYEPGKGWAWQDAWIAK